MVLGLGIPAKRMMVEPGSLAWSIHTTYHATRKNRLHIPDMTRGSLKTLQTEKRVGKPGCRPAEVNVLTDWCHNAGVTGPIPSKDKQRFGAVLSYRKRSVSK